MSSPSLICPSHMPTNGLVVTRPSLHALSIQTSPPSGYPHPGWQPYSPSSSSWVRRDLPPPHPIYPHLSPSPKTSSSGSPTMHNELSPNQASVWFVFGLAPVADIHPKTPNSGTSSLSSALDEDLTRPRRNRDSASPPSPGRISPPAPGCVRISQSCRVLPTFDVIHFRYQSRLGIPVDSLLAGTRQIDSWDNLLSSPSGSTSLMHISVSNHRLTASPSRL